MTGGDLLASALRLIGVLASGETPSGMESADGLLIAQQMLDSWQAERLNIFAIQFNEFPLVPGQQTYTVGTGANFNIPRPARIERYSIVNLNNPAQPLELPLQILNFQDWQQLVPVKLISSTLPQYLYDDNQFPYRNLNYWCVPSTNVNTRLYSWAPLSTFPDLVTDVEFPPAYAKAIRYNLAVDLAPEFGRPVPPEVMLQAMQTKGVLKAMNAPDPQMMADPAVVNPRGRIYNWLTDLPAGR
jgi:hypothetical protein